MKWTIVGDPKMWPLSLNLEYGRLYYFELMGLSDLRLLKKALDGSGWIDTHLSIFHPGKEFPPPINTPTGLERGPATCYGQAKWGKPDGVYTSAFAFPLAPPTQVAASDLKFDYIPKIAPDAGPDIAQILYEYAQNQGREPQQPTQEKEQREERKEVAMAITAGLLVAAFFISGGVRGIRAALR